MGVDLNKQGIWTANGDVNENLLKYIPKGYNPTVYCAYQFNIIKNLEANKTYTMQLWDVYVSHSAKTEAQTGIWVYWGGGSVHLFNWAGPTYFTNGHADYLFKTFTVTSSNASGNGATNAWFNMYNSVPGTDGTRNMKIGKWKLEEGSIPTPWIPAKSDEIYISSTASFVENNNSNKLYIGQNWIDANQFY